ncbi:MAG: N-acetyltransferase [Nakamurella sp.]
MNSPSAVTLRRETPDDVEVVAAVVGTAFGPEEPAVPQLVTALRPFSRFGDDAGALSIVAEVDGAVVGHVLLSLSRLDTWERLIDVLVLSPLAVLPEHQERGIGSSLVAAAIALATEVGAPALFLEGSPTFYGARGFSAAEPLGFRRPSRRIPRPAFQVAVLPAHEGWMTGPLVYAHPFWDLDCVGLRDRALVEQIESGNS